MTRLTPFVLIAALAGCAGPIVVPGLPGQEPAAPAAPPPLPPEVATFLPPGTSSSVVFQDASGCYLYSIEVTNPPSGFPVRDAAGNQICPGQPVTYRAPTAATGATAAPAPAPAPVTTAPVTTAPVTLVPAPATGAVTPGATAPLAQTPPPAPLPVPLPDPVE